MAMAAAEVSPGGVQARGDEREVAAGVTCLRIAIANLFLVRPRGGGGWVLVDAGVGPCQGRIAAAAALRFGRGVPPAAIVLTHGHFDHVGALPELAERWQVPVFAHSLELPYVTGRSAYPPPDPTVGGGMMARMAFLYPRRPLDLGEWARALPEDGSVPGLPEWRWVPTPGHTAGHVSLFREDDRTLIAGDAVITTKQESALAVLTQRPEVHGPPAYFTPDWEAAGRSARALAALRPNALATGHGPALHGPRMQAALDELAREFEWMAVPPRGRYVGHPAVMDAQGVVSVPPPVPDPLPRVAVGLGLLAVGGVLLARRGRSGE